MGRIGLVVRSKNIADLEFATSLADCAVGYRRLMLTPSFSCPEGVWVSYRALSVCHSVIRGL
jgi:hypothetical protein